MSMNPESTGDGLLIVDASGGISWWSSHVGAVPSVELALGSGVVAAIDPADPGGLLAWAVEPGAGADPVADAVGDRALSGTLGELRDLGETVRTFDCPRLRPPWALRALTAAIVRWTTRRVHKGALLVDEAVAELALGHEADARRGFAYAEYALLELGNRCLDGELPNPAVTAVTRALAVAEQVGLGDAVAAIGRRLAATTPVDDDELSAATAAWADAAGMREVPIHGLGSVAPDIAHGHLDLTVLPPRILAWQSARARELRVAHDRDLDVFRLSAPLAADVDPYCREAQQLLAYCADNRTGALIGVTTAGAAAGTVVAELPAQGRSVTTANFGLFAADTDLAALRCDPVGRVLIEVDRDMVEAWNYDRAATVTMTALPADAGEAALVPARMRCDELMLIARTSASNARGRLADLLAGEPAVDETAAWSRDAVTARLAAVDRYREQLLTPVVSTGTTPMLADLIPPDPDAE